MAAENTPAKRPFAPFVVAHKSKIVPLLGDGKIADKLEEVNDEDVHSFDEINEQPPGIRTQLKPHQIEGVSFLYGLRKNYANGILGDEMGLGKTLQILAFFQLIKNTEKENHGYFFVVCPLSVLSSWQNEVDTWTTLRAVQCYGNSEKRRFAWQMVKNQGFDIILTTYETLIADNIRISRMGPWSCVVLDEGHRIKNFSTKLSASVKSLKTRQRLILTGTPIHNDLSEVWSMCNWLYPELFVKETLQYWKKAFSLSKGNVDPEFLNDVKEFLGIIMLRRLKQSTAAGLELPAKQEVILHLPLTQEQKRLYMEIITGCIDYVEDHANDNRSLALQTPPPSPGSEGLAHSHSTNQDARGKRSGRSVINILMELRKVCIHPLLVDTTEERNDDADIMIRELVNTSSKFITLERLLDHEVVRSNKKMLIFSGFDYALDCCQSLLHSMNIPHLRLDGNTPYAVRKFNVHRFQKQDEHRVFAIATRAGGEGITLTAAEVIVFLDLDWNPQIMAQAEARAHRIGQTRPVTIIKMCTQGTVEQQIMNRVNKKLYLATKVISDAAVASSDMSVAESLESGNTFIRRLISRSFTSVTADSITSEDLIHMDYQGILKSCQNTNEVHDYEPASLITTPPSPGANSFNEQEKNWLSQSTRIRTGLFNGTVFQRRRAQLKDAIPENLDSYQRRLNKNRTVYDEDIDYYVDKESTLCRYGEAVPTLTKGNTTKIKAAGTLRFKHLKSCLICGKSRNLEECTFCPQVYHEGCINQDNNASKKNPFGNKTCPHHHCVNCGLTAFNAGGLLLVCNNCPSSYCIDCVYLDSIRSIGDNIPEFEAIGYESPRHVQHITCGDCMIKERENERKRTMTPGDSRVLRSLKRTRRFTFEQ